MSVRERITQLCLTLFDPKIVQAPLSMEFSKQEYWSGLPFLSPGNRLNLGVEPRFPALQADSLSSEPPGKPPGICYDFSMTLLLKINVVLHI